jgi:hypothetical protein
LALTADSEQIAKLAAAAELTIAAPSGWEGATLTLRTASDAFELAWLATDAERTWTVQGTAAEAAPQKPRK